MRKIGAVLVGACLLAGSAVGVSPVLAAPVAPAAPAAAPASAFTAVSPVRMLDTRESGGKVGPGGTVTVQLASVVPPTTTAVVLNVTGVDPTWTTYITAYPGNAARPTASNLNLVPGQVRPNLVTVAVGPDRTVKLFNQNGSTHLVADLTGYYAPDAQSRYTALTPTRLFDSRQSLWPRPQGKVQPNSVEQINLEGRVPRSATAVTFTLTGTGGSAGTYVTAWPEGWARPTASNLNLVPGETAPNLVTVAVGNDRRVNLYNFTGTLDLIVDLSGFYTPDYGSLLTPVAPTRILDTRTGAGAPFGPQFSRSVSLAQTMPARTTGVVMNLTGTEPTEGTFVTAWPSGENRPPTSNLNLVPGETVANLAAVPIGDSASFFLYNLNGTTHLIADVAGYFTLPDLPCFGSCVWAWGSNRGGTLGTGYHGSQNATPEPVHGVSGVDQVVGTEQGGIVLLRDGSVWNWGPNQGGQLGNGWYGTKSTIPVPVWGLFDVVAVDRQIALRADGTVWGWGGDAGGTWGEAAPVQDLDDVVRIAAAQGTYFALKADGTVWSWGDNSHGLLGSGPVSSPTSQAVRVVGLTDVEEIYAGTHSAGALRADGTLWTWGDNREGQLGVGTVGDTGCDQTPVNPACYHHTPTKVPLTSVRDASLFGGNGYAVRTDGTVWSWGSSREGALGNGTTCGLCPSGSPVQVANLTNAIAVSGFGTGAYVRDSSARMWSWGSNLRAQLGPVGLPPSSAYSAVPLPMSAPDPVSGLAATTDAGFAFIP